MSTRIATAVLLAMLACLVPAGSAAADYAPTDRPGPALDVPQAKLAAALVCGKGVDRPTRAPVLLVPGTGATAEDNYAWNYERAFNAAGIPWCAVTFPASGNNDVQINGEYVVYAIRTMFQRAGRPIAIIGHSQGGMVPRWALRWWPDTRSMVDDEIGMAGSNHGTTMAHASCPRGCIPANSQQASDSLFIRALNSRQETFAGISYTEIYTHTDEIVRPNGDAYGSSSLHTGDGRITNVATQDICPADPYEHFGIGTVDPVAYALALDALNHDGPADPARIPPGVCLMAFMPGVNPLTFPQDASRALIDDETSTGDSVTSEPPLACYVTASCPTAGAAQLAPPAACVIARRLRFAVATVGLRRVARVLVYLDGRRVATLSGRARTVRLPRTPRAGVHFVRVVAVGDDGRHRSVRRRFRAC